MTVLSAVCLLLSCCLHAVAGQGAAQIGGAPPQEVQMELCSIGDVFGKLTGITSNEQCRSGCAQGVCPAGWMPTAADECSPECGRVFEPFCERPLRCRPRSTYRASSASLLPLTSRTRLTDAYTRRGPVWQHASAGTHGRYGRDGTVL